MAIITFVRHGNTDHNIENRAQGHAQNPLNEIGRRQAKLVAGRLSEEQWDVLISSDLRRARETAEIISRAIGLPVSFFDKRLREMDRGKITNTIESERVEKWGKDWFLLDMGQETDESMRARGMDFVQDVAAKYAGKKILVVTHGYFLGQTLKALMQDETTGNNLQNTSVTTIFHNGERWEYLCYDCVKHLQGER